MISAFSLVLVCTAGLGGFAVTRVNILNADSGSLASNVQALKPLGYMMKDAQTLRALAVSEIVSGSVAQTAGILAEEATVLRDYQTNWASYAPTMHAGAESADGKGFNAAWGQITHTMSQIDTAEQSGDVTTATQLSFNDLANGIAAFQKNINADFADQTKRANDLADTANAASKSAIILICVVLGMMVLATLVVGWSLIKGISNPIIAMTDAMRRLANKDVQIEIPGVGRKDEIGEMAAAVQVFKDNAVAQQKLEGAAVQFQKDLDAKLRDMEAAFEASGLEQRLVVDGMAAALAELAKGNLMIRVRQEVAAAYLPMKNDFNAAMDTLQTTVMAIGANTQAVRSGAEEITQASDDLSRRTEQQAASLEETAAALDEITATVRKTAEGAKEARQVVATAKTDAARSGEVVKETIAAMSGIESSSKQIGNIISVIDEIAFQTNLLALNAGVEAARAGDAGRGFAVVATEVRALAQRSADAAKEIKTLISASGVQVASGVSMVDETGKALVRTVQQVEQLNHLISEIAASAQEQATGLQEVNTAVNQMDQVTQQNAAMVEQATAASHSLAGEAAELARLVGQFQTGGLAQQVASRPAAKKPVVANSRIPAHAPIGKLSAAAAKTKAMAKADNWDEF